MKVLATGDWHLGAGVAAIGPERLDDHERALEQIVAVANREQVDAFLIAGDVFETMHPRPEELLVLARTLARLDPNIPIVAIPGNGRHDGNFPGRPIALELFDRIEHLHREPSVTRIGDVSIAALPWVSESWLVAQAGGGDRDQLHELAAEHLLTVARGLRASITGPAVLLLHWSVSGAALPAGLPTDMLREAILDAHELQQQGWDAIVCGHIHKPQLLGDGGDPFFYVGSPLPLNFGESGVDHGFYLLEFDAPVPARFVPIASRRFVTVDVDLTGLAAADLTGVVIGHAGVNGDVADALIRVRYRATGEQARHIENDRIRRALTEAGAARAWVQPDVVREETARVAGVDETVGELDALGLYLDAQGIDRDGERGIAITGRTADYLQETPA